MSHKINMPVPHMSNRLIKGILRDISYRMIDEADDGDHGVLNDGGHSLPENVAVPGDKVPLLNATVTLLSRLKTNLRSLRVDAHKQEDNMASELMATRIAEMEFLIDLFEDLHLY